MYNPELARYMQPDPIGVNGGMNIYSYVEITTSLLTNLLGLERTRRMVFNENKAKDEKYWFPLFSEELPLENFATKGK